MGAPDTLVDVAAPSVAEYRSLARRSVERSARRRMNCADRQSLRSIDAVLDDLIGAALLEQRLTDEADALSRSSLRIERAGQRSRPLLLL